MQFTLRHPIVNHSISHRYKFICSHGTHLILNDKCKIFGSTCG